MSTTTKKLFEKMSLFAERNYFKSFLTGFVIFLFYLFGVNTSFIYTSILNYSHIKPQPFDGAVYPIEYIPNPILLNRDERNQRFEDIDSKYFVKLPKYNSDILLQDPNTLTPGSDEYVETLISRIAYTVVYMGNYTFDYREYAGSHPSVDIVAPIGTPIRSIANGVVVKSGFEAGGFGNHLVIRHDNVPLGGEKQTIYSSYSHMNDRYVKPGEIVLRGQMIGTVGNTGISTAPHLDFQIALSDSPFLPFRPFTGAEARAAGLGFFTGINAGLGFDKAIKYTINPLEFINNNLNNSFNDNYLVDNSSGIPNLGNNEDVLEESLEDTNKEIIEEKDSIEEEKIEVVEDVHNNEEINNANQEESKEEIVQVVDRDSLVDAGVEIITDSDSIVLLDNVEIAMLGRIESLLASNSYSNISELEDLFSNLDSKEGIFDIVSDDNLEKIDIDNVINDIIEEKNDNEEPKEDNTITDSILDNKVISIFADIDNSHPYFEKIKFFKDNGIINGFSDNTFRPNNNITRAESLKIILLGLGFNPIENKQSQFRDINTNSWENSFINSAISLGIIDTSNSNFYPFRNISRVEGLKLVLELGDIDLTEISSSIGYKDVDKDMWYYDYVRYSSDNNLLETDGVNFHPDKPLSRQELVSIIYKFIKK